MKIAVVIPAYNEEKRIAKVLERLPQEIDGHPVQVIVVDDGSADTTYAVVNAHQHPDLTLLKHQTNLGKGAAAKTGCDAAYFLGAEVIVLMDGDDQHRPEDLPKMTSPILEGEKNLITIGSRSLNRSMPTTMRIGNQFFNLVTRLMFDIKTRDTQSGYRAFHREIYPKIRWIAPNYAMETEMLILSAIHLIPVQEVEIPTVYHDGFKGTTVLDGMRIMKTMLKWRLFKAKQLAFMETWTMGLDTLPLDISNK